MFRDPQRKAYCNESIPVDFAAELEDCGSPRRQQVAYRQNNTQFPLTVSECCEQQKQLYSFVLGRAMMCMSGSIGFTPFAAPCACGSRAKVRVLFVQRSCEDRVAAVENCGKENCKCADLPPADSVSSLQQNAQQLLPSCAAAAAATEAEATCH